MIRPKTINFSITDRCNSECVMCNVWKEKPSKEMMFEDIDTVFARWFLRNVEFLGVSGGEISLVPDIDIKIDIICSKLKQLKEISFIYNCVDADKTIESIKKVRNVCEKHSVVCNLELSFDGLDGVHDSSRGVKGAFANLINVIEWLQLKGINFRCDCTITKTNCSNLNSLDIFCKNKNIKIKYRLASFINRLANLDREDEISSYTNKEKYQIMTFLSKQISKIKKNDKQISIYKNINEYLRKDNFCRILCCPYRSIAIYLGPDGKVYTCAPAGRFVGDLSKRSVWLIIIIKLFLDRARLRFFRCKKCYHDYNAGLTLAYRIKRKLNNIVHERTKRFLLR